MSKNVIYQLYPILPFYASVPKSVKREGSLLGRPVTIESPPDEYDLWAMQDDIAKIEELQADYVYLSAALNSPRKDHGFDVQDYMRIDPMVGVMTSEASIYPFSSFISDIHSIGAQVIIDLILNHTSVMHPWFLSRREDFYYFLDKPKDDWENLFDQGSSWKYDPATKKYYLHLFHDDQADLAWYDAQGNLNKALVAEFRRIVQFWLNYGVDGFRLDVAQLLNKDINAESFRFGDVFYGNRGKEVINAIFDGLPCTLMLEVFDPTFGSIINDYIQNTPVRFCTNVMVKGLFLNIREDEIRKSAKVPGFVLDLESHDSCRCLSRPGMSFEKELELMFDSGVSNIMIYQGQEFGLKNPELSLEQMLDLDAQAAMKYARGVPFEKLRDISRANARFLLPKGEYKRQRESDDLTPFKQMRDAIASWKLCP